MNGGTDMAASVYALAINTLSRDRAGASHSARDRGNRKHASVMT